MKLYILDIRKPYHEDVDGYAGVWFHCPVDWEEIKKSLGVGQEEDFEIADEELPFSISVDTLIEKGNAKCRMI